MKLPLTPDTDEREKPSVLVVDDNEASLYLMNAILQSHNFKVQCLADSTMVLEQARTFAPDVILLDIMMPEVDGFAVCSELKADPSLCKIPVLFLTSLTEEKHRQRCFEVGGSDYLPKPVDPEELLKRIHSALESYQRLTGKR